MKLRTPLCIAILLLHAARAHATLGAGIGKNFTGSSGGVVGSDSLAAPADTDGCVGPNHFVEFLNGRFAVYSKTNNTSPGPKLKSQTDLAFWTAAGVTIPSGWDVTDPRMMFDPVSQRWFALEIDYDPTSTVNTNHFLLAVSTNNAPTNVWKGFSIAADPVNFADYPTLGIDTNGVYLSANMFSSAGTEVGSLLISIPKTNLISGTLSVARRTKFPIAASSVRGEILQPAVALDGTGAGDVLAVANLGYTASSTTLKSFNVQNSATTNATLSSITDITVPDYTAPLNPPQPDGSINLDDGDARIGAYVYRVGGVLYAVHSTDFTNQAAMKTNYASLRWYRISATNHALLESGTITHTNLHLIYPSIAANTNGAVVIGCSGTSSNSFISAYAVMGETVNGTTTFGKLMLLKAGTTSYQDPDPTSGISRWGDYSATSVDPSDANRFWTIQSYASGTTKWSTQIAEIITGPLQFSLVKSGTNAILSWASFAGGYQLTSRTNLVSGGAWSSVTQPRVTNAPLISVTVPLSGTEKYFRLE